MHTIFKFSNVSRENMSTILDFYYYYYYFRCKRVYQETMMHDGKNDYKSLSFCSHNIKVIRLLSQDCLQNL